MPTCKQVAQELRNLADHLEQGGETEIQQAWITFYHSAATEDKEKFKQIAKFLPRPLKKVISDPNDDKWARLKLEHDTCAVQINATIPRSATCRIIQLAQPAKYECDPVLSEEEEAEVGGEI